MDYVEAHGTGTTVGDPIEINAVAEVYCKGREPGHPLLTGSVKTNVGHLESAAGVAGVIKAVLAIKQGVIPKHLNFHDPNPAIDWDHLPLQVTTDSTEWPRRNGRTRLAGVNSFGISGTNAHIVLGEYISPDTAPGKENRTGGSAQMPAVSLPANMAHLPLPEQELRPRETRFLPLSGKSENALRELAQKYLSWLDEKASGPMLSDMAWTGRRGTQSFRIPRWHRF